MNWRFWMLTGSISAALSIMLGAFAAHRLQGVITAESLALIETAQRYQIIHSIALLLTGFAAMKSDLRKFQAAGVAFLGGIVFFSGSLYAMGITGLSWLGAITPIGGLSLIVGWILLGYGLASIR